MKKHLLCSNNLNLEMKKHLLYSNNLSSEMKKHLLCSNNLSLEMKKHLLCWNNFSLEMKKKLIKSCIRSVAVCGSETGTLGKNEERVVNAFETWSWRRMLKIKWTDRITKDEVFQRAKEERLLLISNFRRVLNVVCFLLGNSPASEFYMPTFRNTLFHLHRRIGMKDSSFIPLYESRNDRCCMLSSG